MEDIHLCELCLREFEPVGTWLRVFNGYAVDLRLQQFRKVGYGKLPQLIEFTSTKGQELLAQMHEEVTR